MRADHLSPLGLKNVAGLWSITWQNVEISVSEAPPSTQNYEHQRAVKMLASFDPSELCRAASPTLSATRGNIHTSTGRGRNLPFPLPIRAQSPFFKIRFILDVAMPDWPSSLLRGVSVGGWSVLRKREEAEGRQVGGSG